jgi:RES domain-containing protein
VTIFRLHRVTRLAHDYKGAMVAGGRWNPIGTPMLYTSEHLSLGCLEGLVHLDKGQLPRDYVWSKTETELSDIPEMIEAAEDMHSISACQAVGGDWVRSAKELAVRVPSVVIPEEFNVLLNPNHAGYAALVWSEPHPFRFDPRLFAVEPYTL